jgi:hypothetical protein
VVESIVKKLAKEYDKEFGNSFLLVIPIYKNNITIIES